MQFPPFEYNRQSTKENTQKTISQSLEAGQRIILGYAYENSELCKNEDEAEAIQNAFEDLVERRLFLYQISSNLQKYCEKHGIEDSSTGKPLRFYPMKVLRILRTPQYSGRYYDSNAILCPSIYPKLVNVEIWDQAQSILDYREYEGRGSTKQYDHPLSGFLRCSKCTKHYYWKQRVFDEKETGLQTSYTANYQHITIKDADCETDTYVSSKKIDPLIRMLIMKLFTTKEYLPKLYEAYKEYFNDVLSNPNHQYKVYNIKNADAIFAQIRLLLKRAKQNLSKAQSELNYSDKKINDLVIAMNDLKSSFNDYLKKSIKTWTTGEKIERFDLIRTVFETILVGKDVLTFSLGVNEPITINYKSLAEYWQEQAQKYGEINKTKITEIEDFDEIISYTQIVGRQITNLNITAYLQSANTMKLELYSMNRNLSCKIFEEVNDFICISDATKLIECALIYRINNEGDYFLLKDLDNVAIKVTKKESATLIIEMNNETYLNERYLHQHPEWYYGKNFEYFKVGMKRYAFKADEDRIIALYLKNRGTPQEMPVLDTINEIMKSDHLKYIQIE
jgi:hypothetical protein